MAIFGLHKILVPPTVVGQLNELLEDNGMRLHRLYDITEGGEVDVLCIGGTGSRPLRNQGQAPAEVAG